MLKPIGMTEGHYECRSLDETLPIFTELLAAEVIERTDKLLRDVGVSGEIHFRPPHAAKFIVLPYVLVQMKKLSVLGDVDPEEWKRPSAAVMTESILRQVRPGSIIGLHDPMGAETLRTLQNILPVLTARGYRFETVSALVSRRRQSR